jgi:hypothetical protein
MMMMMIYLPIGLNTQHLKINTCREWSLPRFQFVTTDRQSEETHDVHIKMIPTVFSRDVNCKAMMSPV